MYRFCSVIGQSHKTCNTLNKLILDPVAPGFISTHIPHRNKRTWKKLRDFEVGRAIIKFRQSIERSPDPLAFPKLAPQQITSILELNQYRKELSENSSSAIKNFDVNKLPSNDPIEDRDVQGRLLFPEGSSKYLFGVYDGHSGIGCSQTLVDRLFQYIATSMAPYEILEKVTRKEMTTLGLLEMYKKNPNMGHIPESLFHIYNESILTFARETLASFDHHSIQDNLISAFTRLDLDMLAEGLPNSHKFCRETLEASLSGSCACIALVDDTEIYIANTGDCRAVLGVEGLDGEWNHLELSNTHDCHNIMEKRRILTAHPNESTNIIKHGRLFGELAPTRAFGDCRYKWSLSEVKTLKEYFGRSDNQVEVYTDRVVPNNYQTPPYLTAEPEVIKHSLTPKDKFLVLASDGLWDMLTPEKVVKLVAGHMLGKQVMIPQDLNYQNMGKLSEINTYLKQRKVWMENIVIDDNVATHLLRNAFGPDHGRISAYLSLPENMSRSYRDDTTIIVIYFDSDYIKNKCVSL